MGLSSKAQLHLLAMLATSLHAGTSCHSVSMVQVKQGGPEYFGLTCKNHKQSNDIRGKRKARNIVKRLGK